MLAACSHYFQAMFSGGLRESLDKDVNFRDSIHPEVPAPPCPPLPAPPPALTSALLQILELLLDFAYSSRVVISEENAESLLQAGDMLQFHDVRDAAADFLESHLTSSNCLGMMLLADAHQCQRLHELSWRMCLLHYETVAGGGSVCSTLPPPPGLLLQEPGWDELPGGGGESSDVACVLMLFCPAAEGHGGLLLPVQGQAAGADPER